MDSLLTDCTVDSVHLAFSGQSPSLIFLSFFSLQPKKKISSFPVLLLNYLFLQNTDAVHLALKLNESDLMGRKVRVKRCGKKQKAPQKSGDQSRSLKDRADTTSKNRSCSNTSFVGEKAIPLKKSTKQKGLKTVPRSKAVKKTVF